MFMFFTPLQREEWERRRRAAQAQERLRREVESVLLPTGHRHRTRRVVTVRGTPPSHTVIADREVQE